MWSQRRPRPPLDRVVRTLWTAERIGHAVDTGARGGLERLLPDGCVDLVLTLRPDGVWRGPVDQGADGLEWLPGGIVQGATDGPLLRRVPVSSCVVGLQFQPGGAAAVLHLPAGALGSGWASADAVLGTEAARLREQLAAAPDADRRLDGLEAWALARLHSAPRCLGLDARIAAALQAYAADPLSARVAPVQRASGLGPAAFSERFTQAVGLPPKRWLRVRRFQRLLQSLTGPPREGWLAVGLDAGYADQPHLVREFRALAGLTPRAWQPVRPEWPNHVAVDPAKDRQDKALDRR